MSWASLTTTRLKPTKTELCWRESHHSAGNFATLQQLVLTGAPTTFICSQWWKSDFSAKGFSHPRRSVERSALAIASAILFMPSGRFEPKPA